MLSYLVFLAHPIQALDSQDKNKHLRRALVALDIGRVHLIAVKRKQYSLFYLSKGIDWKNCVPGWYDIYYSYFGLKDTLDETQKQSVQLTTSLNNYRPFCVKQNADNILCRIAFRFIPTAYEE